MSTIEAEVKAAPGIKPETAAMLEDAQFLIDTGTHPLLAAQMLKRKPDSIAKSARFHGMPELATLFERKYTNWEEQP